MQLDFRLRNGGLPLCRAARTRWASSRISAVTPLAGGGGDRVHARCRAPRSGGARSSNAPRRGGVDLVGGDDLRLGGEAGSKSASSRLITSKSSSGSRPLMPLASSRWTSSGGARHVAQEAVAEAVAVVRARDQAGDVGEDEGRVVVDPHHAEVRHQRGERDSRRCADARPRRG